jgi:hypothetical protein
VEGVLREGHPYSDVRRSKPARCSEWKCRTVKG